MSDLLTSLRAMPSSLNDACRTMETAADQIEALVKALQALVDNVNDYERVNNLAPAPGRTECWDTVARAKEVLAAVGVSRDA